MIVESLQLGEHCLSLLEIPTLAPLAACRAGGRVRCGADRRYRPICRQSSGSLARGRDHHGEAVRDLRRTLVSVPAYSRFPEKKVGGRGTKPEPVCFEPCPSSRADCPLPHPDGRAKAMSRL